jgi:hypothetical protein
MTNTRAINAAAGVIHACMQQGKTLPASQAYALEAAGLLNSPEHAAEVEQLHTKLDGARLSLWEEEQDSKRARLAAKNARQRAAKLRARVAELEAAAGDGGTRTVDEDPIAYSLTPEALHAASGAVIEVPAQPGREESLPPQLRKALEVMAKRGPVVELTAPREEPHDDPVGLHHDYRTPHDLPEIGGAR